MGPANDTARHPKRQAQQTKSDVHWAKVQCQVALFVILLGGMATNGPSTLIPSASAVVLIGFLLLATMIVVIFALRKLRQIGFDDFGILTWLMLVLTCGQIGGCLYRLISHAGTLLAR
jgi:hypothetical protein